MVEGVVEGGDGEAAAVGGLHDVPEFCVEAAEVDVLPVHGISIN